MTQYMLSVPAAPADRPAPSEEDMMAAYARVAVFNDSLTAADAMVFGGGLLPVAAARTVSGAAPTSAPEAVAVATGNLGGFWVIEAASDAEALDWAVRGSAACGEVVEVRAFQSE